VVDYVICVVPRWSVWRVERECVCKEALQVWDGLPDGQRNYGSVVAGAPIVA
jgi:hypothetical protein